MPLKQRCKGIWIVPLILILDRITKLIAMHALRSVAVLPNILNWNYAKNTGMAFSLLSKGTLFLSILTFFVLAGVMLWMLVRPQSQPGLMRTGLWILVGGGLGNLYDRVFYGYVVDFIELAFMRFAIFNLADVAVVVGAILTAIGFVLEERKKAKTHG